ncbi:hypothetical protein L484_010631 [Morus notabilis]|uniref:Uncharacterized protein n=2 Tax=Morus notabilis TaxID=981085 RepID=W9RE33_9ROSA|nr:hypothetical protein L484_010631 [Morus notabilis]
MFPPNMFGPTSSTTMAGGGGLFSSGQELLFQMPHQFPYNNIIMSSTNNQGGSSSPAAAIYGQNANSRDHKQYYDGDHQMQGDHDDAYGLLQDMVPSMFLKQEP